MAELSEYIAALTRDRDNLAANLQKMGVEADNTETFTSLAAKVLEIATSGVSLPVLSNPATASEILEGYEAIDQDGNVITGAFYGGNVILDIEAPQPDTIATEVTASESMENVILDIESPQPDTIAAWATSEDYTE